MLEPSTVNLDRPTISVDDFAAVMEISRSSAYAAVDAGEVPHVRLGRRIRIPSASVRRMLAIDEAGRIQSGDAA